MNIDTSPKGWSCPKCARVWAPHIAACAACNDRQTIQAPQRPPYIGSPTWEGPFEPRFTCEAPSWNFNGDDLSYT